jgi:hypothetical protein
MDHREKRMALRMLRRGNPIDVIKLYEAQIVILKQEFGKSTCQGCAKGFYERKIRKYEEEIRMIKEDKRFRRMNLNAKN